METPITMKTILVPMEDDAAMQSALETALLLARRYDSYMEGFALRWQIAGVAEVDMVGGIPSETYTQDAVRIEQQARGIFESFMQKHDVPQSTAIKDAFSFGWLESAPEGYGFVGSYGRVFDVIVMNRLGENTTGLHNRAVDSGLFGSGRPILLAPPSPPQQIANNVLITWNCSTEQARATAPLGRRLTNCYVSPTCKKVNKIEDFR